MMKTLWILVPAMVLALALPQAASACPGCGKDKAAEGGATFGAEQGGCPHAQKGPEAGECPYAKAAADKAGGEGTCEGHGDCKDCPMHKDGAGTCAQDKDGKGCACKGKDGKECGCAMKDGKACDCKDCPHRKDGTCPHHKGAAEKPASAPAAPAKQ